MNGTRVRRGLIAAATGLLWAALVTGSAVLALTIPVYTSALSQSLDIAASAGLPQGDVLRLSDQVRALVADREYDALPAVWAGQPGFDEAAVSHLMDVRQVIAGARLATGVAALVLAVVTAIGIATRRLDELRAGMRAGAIVLAVVLVLAAVAAFSDFEWLFAQFHGLFFAAGTWSFPADSLLIRLFPERFWMASGAAWAALMALGAGVLLLAARYVRGAQARLSASRTPNNV